MQFYPNQNLFSAHIQLFNSNETLLTSLLVMIREQVIIFEIHTSIIS